MMNQRFNVGRRSRGALAILVGTLVGVFNSPSAAQITPERTYYGFDRPIPFGVSLSSTAQAAKITLFHADGTELASADVAAGRADLSALFPQLWSDDHQHVHYAQLVVDDERVGAPVVLQPMLTPQYAYPMNAQTGQPEIPPRRATPVYQQQMIEAAAKKQGLSAPPRQVVYSGLRASVDKHIVFETSAGEIEFRLRPDEAPNTCWNFLALAEGGFYTDIIFHRVVARAGNGYPFVVQVGDPTGTGAGGPGYFIDLEPTGLPHDFGVLSMARSGEPNSGGSQVFVCLSRDGTSFLDGNYTAFAEAVRGREVINAIAASPVGAQDRPLNPPVLIAARVIDAPPFGTGPDPLSKPEESETPAETPGDGG